MLGMGAQGWAMNLDMADLEKRYGADGEIRPGAILKSRPVYAVLVEYRWARGATVEFSLVSAIRSAKEFWGDHPESVSISVKFADGTDMEIDSRSLSRSTQTPEQARAEIIEAARSNLAAMADGTGVFRSIDLKPDIWNRILGDGPTEDEIAMCQSAEREWFTDEEVAAFEATMPKSFSRGT